MVSSSSSSLLLLSSAAFLLLLLPTPSAAHNVTRILDQFPEFTTFNLLLNQTKVNLKINSRTTITVLVVDNGAAGSLSGQDPDVLENILSAHVLLDYYDAKKLAHISKKPTIITTLFQSSGVANGRNGFLNMSLLPDGEVGFGSAVQGGPLNSQFIKEVTARPFNISIIQVSNVIYPPGIGAIMPPPPPPAAPAPRKAEPVSPAPAPAPAEADAPAADAPAPESDAPAADAPNADAPSPGPAADAPEADSPAKADGPAADDKADDKEESLAAGKLVAGAGLAVAVVAAFVGGL